MVRRIKADFLIALILLMGSLALESCGTMQTQVEIARLQVGRGFAGIPFEGDLNLDLDPADAMVFSRLGTGGQFTAVALEPKSKVLYRIEPVGTAGPIAKKVAQLTYEVALWRIDSSLMAGVDASMTEPGNPPAPYMGFVLPKDKSYDTDLVYVIRMFDVA